MHLSDSASSLPDSSPAATDTSDDAPLLKLAAIDLGSNSFHLLLANHQAGQLQVVAKQGEKIQLAAGLDEDGMLSEDAMERALNCLAQFAPFLDGIEAEHLRIVGTNALRAAHNSQTLIDRAEELLGHPIEIIAGREEARLIYLGAAHALADVHGKRLIIDIGGGSTEFIIGEQFEPLLLESLHMGCVAYTKAFFSDGEISEKRMRRAELAARSELASIQRSYRELGWDDPVGSSGTIKAAASVMEAHGWAAHGLVTREGLHRLRTALLGFKRLDKVSLPGLKSDRASVFPAGVAILCGIFEALELEQIRYSDGALREGVLFDLIGRNTAEDSRIAAIDLLRRRYGIDTRHAANVRDTALALFDQVADTWSLGATSRQMLAWGAELHEVGLAISHSQFHRHGAYLIEHSDLQGFSRPEQKALAFLVRAHRRKFASRELANLPLTLQPRLARLARLLRIAVMLNHSRPEQPVLGTQLSAKGDELRLSLAEEYRDHSLICDDLTQESSLQKASDMTLTLEDVD
ncbi:exopolyphosphatase [Cobetia marina]|uniref:exopolyphosphatase n=1 Tax=Cobetia marina TaxID=28258 RepID=UPI0010AED1F3|nr:exopolyphosphatase [Cobetia marina]